MNLLLSIFAVIISIVGAIVFLLAFLNDNVNWWTGGIYFASIVIPGIINDMYEDTLRKNYEYPNREKQITYDGKIYKKKTFQADYKFKGYVPCLIISFIQVEEDTFHNM